MEELPERRGPGRPPKLQHVESPSIAPEQGPQEAPQRRRARNPFGSQAQQLDYSQRVGFHRHWFNDGPEKPWVGRVQKAQNGGYEHVKDEQGKNVVKVVGSLQAGGPLHAYLMEIPEEWYQEDMRAQQAEIDAKESSMKRGQFERTQDDRQYVGKQGITIKHGS